MLFVCDFRQSEEEVRRAAGQPCGRVAGARSTWAGHQLGRSQGPHAHGGVCVRPQPQRHRGQGGHPQSWRRNSRGESRTQLSASFQFCLKWPALECDPLYFTDCSRLSANSIKAASSESKVIVFANKVRNWEVLSSWRDWPDSLGIRNVFALCLHLRTSENALI